MQSNRKLSAFGYMAAASLALAWAATARASLFVTDNFDSYLSGSTIATDDGGFGWSSAWRGNIGVVSPGLDGSANAVLAGPTETSLRLLPSSIGAAGTTLYISFLAAVNETDQVAWVGLFQDGFFQLLMGDGPTTTTWGYSRTSASSFFSSTPANSTPTRLVYGIQFDSDAATITMWVNPTSQSDTPAVSPESVASFTADQLMIFAPDSAESITVDDLRLGTTFGDVVVPEPAGVLPILLAAMALARRQRR